ncbi:MAG TPA: ABC transporter ATP-binding protein [Geothermobacteraceae bacterium]|nr:ABC transporter ATP-binding protein [Geothermobacteraceae bacterium]
MLSVENLEVKYGNIQALHGISFHVNQGEMVTLIGANGAGKTTSLYAIARLQPPEAPRVTGGEIRFQGQSMIKTPPASVVKDLKLALVPEGRHIFGNLTVMENLELATYSRSRKTDLRQEYQRVFDLFPRLHERRKQRSESLSGGEQQMLAVGRALMTGCNFLMLDEPSMGLAPVIKYDLFRTLKRLNQEGMTILLVEQNAKLALELAHRGYVLDTGTIVAEGTGADLLGNPEVKKAYLGG